LISCAQSILIIKRYLFLQNMILWLSGNVRWERNGTNVRNIFMHFRQVKDKYNDYKKVFDINLQYSITVSLYKGDWWTAVDVSCVRHCTFKTLLH